MPNDSEFTPGPIEPGQVEISPLGTQTAVTPENAIIMRGALPRPAGAFPSPSLPPWMPTPEQIAAQKAQEDQEFEMRKLQGQISGLPFDQAQKATTAAMKIQGQRGYSADLAAGKPAHEALAKWAPMIFFDRPQTLAGAVRQSFTQPRPAPRWVPPDPSTGAPGHFESGVGTIHIPPAAKPPGPAKLDQLTQFDLHTKAAAVTAAQRAVSAAVASGNEDAAANARKALKTASDDYSEFRRGLTKQLAPAIGAAPPAPAARVVAPPGAVSTTAARQPETPVQAPLPLPKSKSDLVVNQRYTTRHGTYVWDGDKLRRTQ